MFTSCYCSGCYKAAETTLICSRPYCSALLTFVYLCLSVFFISVCRSSCLHHLGYKLPSFLITAPLRSFTISLQPFDWRLTVTFHATCRSNVNCCPLGFATPYLVPYPDYVITLVTAQRQFQATYFDVSSASDLAWRTMLFRKPIFFVLRMLMLFGSTATELAGICVLKFLVFLWCVLVFCGVPQASVSGFLVFNISVHDITVM
jgi:hypothetical protein